MDEIDGGNAKGDAQTNVHRDLADHFGEGSVNSVNCDLACGLSATEAMLPPLLAGDSSDSLCHVDLPNDFATSPMKLAEILSLLLESPEKDSSTTDHAASLDAPIARPSDNGNCVGDVNGRETSSPAHPRLQRSHSYESGLQKKDLHQELYFGDPSLSASSLAVFRRSTSVDGHQQRHFPTSILPQICFSSIPATVNGDDHISSLFYECTDGSHEEDESAMVNISGYSLPLVSVDGDTTAYVCATDVFQSFFSTRHWDEFKNILEKNGIRTSSAVASSSNNAFGVPETVDAISVKDVESLLLNNQARKDGFVRCMRLSMNAEVQSLDSSATASSTGTATESKIILMPERKVGELSSGIRTRHADQSDILYVELDGRTLPSIILNNVQYVRLVDVRQKFFASEVDDKQISPSSSFLSKQFQTLKNACAKLGIQVSKCRPNEKARMVVYANSCYSNSLHIIAARQLPTLIEFVRSKIARKKNSRLLKDGLRRRLSAPNVNGRYSAQDDEMSVQSNLSSAHDQLSPLSRPDSADSSGSDSSSYAFMAPPSPFDGNQQVGRRGAKRRATLDVHQKPKRMRSESKQVGTRNLHQDEGSSDVRVWRNGHLRNYLSSADSFDNDSDDNSNFGRSDRLSKFTGYTNKAFEISHLVNTQTDFELGRDEDNLLDMLTPKATVAPCSIVIDSSPPLPVVVYNRLGSRGAAGKYYDHLFVSRNAACVWCIGCDEFFNLCEFLSHAHDGSPAVPNPQLFVWVSNVKDAKLGLWRSLLRKVQAYNLRDCVQYDLPNNFANEEKEKTNLGIGSRRFPALGFGIDVQEPLGGAPTPPPPVAFRRRPVRGDAFIDVLERFSSASYKPPTAKSMGLYSSEHESEVDASYGN